jgi:gluconate 5-dehydrogenase
VVLNARSEDALSDAAETLSATGAAVDIERFDVTDAEAVRDGVARIEARSPIDILVNNAGMQRRASLESFKDEDWRAIMSTNLDGVYYVSKSVAPSMITRGSGKIINIGSVQCELARPGIAPYTASKGAVKNLTKGMCADWAKHGIQVNAIAPGYFDTPLNRPLVEDKAFDEWLRNRTPAGRWGKLEDLHGAVVFLASSAADFVNGQTIFVDGGMVSVV